VARQVLRAEFGNDRGAEVVEGRRNALHLGRVEVAEDGLQPVLLERLRLVEGPKSTLGDSDADDASVVRNADPLDQAALLHPIDDAGGVAVGDIEELGQPAHRKVSVVLEQPHDMHVGHAHSRLHEAAGAGAAESRDHVVDARGDPGSGRLGADSCCVGGNSSHVVNNLPTGNQSVKRLDPSDPSPEHRRVAVRFALMIEAQQGLSYLDQLALARRAEAAGFEAFFRSDHYASFPGPSDGPTTDGWTVLAGLARETERIALGVLVSPVTFRRPGNFVKVVTTVDEMSGGRIEVGVGAGWNESDHLPLGLPFPEIGERADLMEDELALLHGLWTEPDGWDFEGHQIRVEGGFLRPKPVDVPGRPHAANGSVRPRIIVGGEGSPRGFRIAARYADEFNLTSSSPERTVERYAALDAACSAAGREPSTITHSAMIGVMLGADEADVGRRRTALLRALGVAEAGGSAWYEARTSRWILGTPDEARAMVRRFADAGVERIMLQDFLPLDLEMVALMGAELVGKV